MRVGQKTQFARQLRANLTDAERCLWRRLRGRQLAGARFRRQVPIGPFVADFACLERRLVIEVDGGQHQGSRYDAGRDGRLRHLGFKVMRFWDNDVLLELEAVLAMIMLELAMPTPPPQPSPVNGGGGVTKP